jgi:mevalonate kinase
MPVTRATAPGKAILFGEHAVVYGRPAIAAPLAQLRAEAAVEDSVEAGVWLRASDLGREYWLEDAASDDPFAKAVRVFTQAALLDRLPSLRITVHSSIPIASGLGSGAAMAAAVVRALALHLGHLELASDDTVSALTYEVETLLHGTPSGIDNTVVSFERPVFFVRREPKNVVETFSVAATLRFLVADTGVVSMTKAVVGDVRRSWQADPAFYEKLFDGCGRVAKAARKAIECGEVKQLGFLMAENQVYLRQMGVSSPELEAIISAAERSGALGAKLSGAGRGGNAIALVTQESEAGVRKAMLAEGARHVLSGSLTP